MKKQIQAGKGKHFGLSEVGIGHHFRGLIESALPVFTFASLVDNQSADAIFIPGTKDEVLP